MVVLRLVRDNILPEERRRTMDYIRRALDDRTSGWQAPENIYAWAPAANLYASLDKHPDVCPR